MFQITGKDTYIIVTKDRKKVLCTTNKFEDVDTALNNNQKRIRTYSSYGLAYNSLEQGKWSLPNWTYYSTLEALDKYLDIIKVKTTMIEIEDNSTFLQDKIKSKEEKESKRIYPEQENNLMQYLTQFCI